MMTARSMERFVFELDTALDKQTGGDPTSEAEVTRKLSAIVEDCGWKKRSHERMEQLEESLVATAAYPSEDLTDLSIPLSRVIRFGRQKPGPPALEFLKERDLERFIAKNHRLFFARVRGLGDLRHEAGGTRSQRRFPFGRSYVKPDLVFKTRDGTVAVVEVKLGPPDDGAVGQLRKYLAAASRRHDSVRGILVTGIPRSRVHEALIVDEIAGLGPYQVDWIQYRVDTMVIATM